ncbi:MAG: SpoIIE family protein phosphatase [Bacteroidetes bacterium]|nr:SpoIIE family protein phosphatase [Bacteroidota bacterium]
MFNSKQVVEEGHYLDSKKINTWKTYHDNNKLKSEINYKDDLPFGLAKFFNSDGKLLLEGNLDDKNFVGDYYLYDANGNKVSKKAKLIPTSAYIAFSGNVRKSLGKSLDGVKIVVERNDFEIGQYTTDANGDFEIKLELNFDYTLIFSKSGYSSQSILINAHTTNIYDTLIYPLNDWKVVLNDNIATAATSDLFGFLLNKPSSKIYYNKRKKRFDADGAYVNLFKKEFKGISETTKLMLAKAAEDNKKLEIENLRIEAEKKEKEIELLTKAQMLKEAELKNREAEIQTQKIAADKAAADAKNEAELRNKEKHIKELEIKQQQEQLALKELQAAQQAKEFERLAMVRKLQELELKTKEQQLDRTSNDLNNQKIENANANRELSIANREKQIKDKELKQNLIYIYFMLGVLGVIGVFTFFLIKNIQQKKKANVLLEKQAAEIAEKSKIIEIKKEETEQSILYAKRIQYAILPPDNEINKYLKNYFIYYKPKDIVSGDFYFFSDQYANDKDKSGTVTIAAVDCTGHGVPGAFMSMVGNEKLKDALDVSSNPQSVLMELNKGIKQALRQESEDGTKDGMDIAICTLPAFINSEKAIIKYAGANRPLWLVRKNSNFVEEFRATKQAIGGHTDINQVFDQVELELNKGDTIYLHSDGYADQFGGPTKKKLMTKKFKEILCSIQHLSLNDQKEYLKKFMEDWCVDTEQIDDILVIGIKI